MQLDLSTLSTPELRSLLDSARAHGRAAESYRILQEMAARRDSEPPPRIRGGRARRAETPRLLTLELGDPLERADPPASDAPEPAAADPIAGLTLDRADLKPTPTPQPARPRVLTFAAGAAAGALAGWIGATAAASSALPQLVLPQLTLPDLGALVGRAATAAEPKPEVVAQEAPPAPTGEAPPLVTLDAAAASRDAGAVTEEAVAASVESAPDPAATPAEAATELPLPPPPPPPPEEADADGACAAQPTPADRAICADPDLQRLQRDLRHAYAEALDAHADRLTLRERQLAWRDARDPIGDPAKLSALYAARIHKLRAATAEARRVAGRP